MSHHSVMTSSLLIKILKIDKFGDLDIFRDDISLIINQCHLQATEGSLRRTRSVRQPRSASKRTALVNYKTFILLLSKRENRIVHGEIPYNSLEILLISLIKLSFGVVLLKYEYPYYSKSINGCMLKSICVISYFMKSLVISRNAY